MQITNSIISQSPSTSSATPIVAWYQEPITIFTFIIATVIVNSFAIYKSWNELRNQQKLFIEGQNLKERDDIRYKLNHFFGPMKELRGESRILYDVFALTEKAESENNKSYFRTVTYLTDGHSFSDQDKALLDEIIAIGAKQIELIEKEGWAVTNLHLTELLGQLGAHIRILRMANENKLKGMTDGIKDLVFPLEIDGALEAETRKLQDRYAELLGSSNNKRNSENLDDNQTKTIEYYNRNYLRYYKETAFIDMSDIYKKFRKYIPRGALILDAGCGVGRDTRYFIKHGYRVVSFDASHEMVQLCRQYTFSYCIRRSFNEISFVEEFDAVWACASLIHVPPEKLQEAIFHLYNSVKPNGIIYFSIKAQNQGGIPSEVLEGRCFYYYDPQDVRKIVEDNFALELIEEWKNPGKKATDLTQWTNFVYRKLRFFPLAKEEN